MQEYVIREHFGSFLVGQWQSCWPNRTVWTPYTASRFATAEAARVWANEHLAVHGYKETADV